MTPTIRRRRGSSRWRLPLAVVAAVTLAATGCGAALVRAAPVTQDGAMFDDFNGPGGSPPDSRMWSYDLGGGGWGNNEVQTYTDSPENVRLDGDGHLVIDAVRQADGGFTSARLTTRGKFSFTYGRAEARIKLPSGDGVHTGFWLLGADIDRVGWPRSGEIDVIETINDPTTATCTAHGPTATGGDWQAGMGKDLPVPLSADFHTYWVQRSPGSITTGVDQQVTCALTAANVGAQNIWVFDKPFNLLLNVAIGGNYPGPPDAQTPSPATMLIDWVKVTPT